MQNFPRLIGDPELSKKAFIDYGNCKYTIDTFIRLNVKGGFRTLSKKKRTFLYGNDDYVWIFIVSDA